MKPGIHPDYRPVVFQDATTGAIRVVAVAATDRDKKVASFSSRGPGSPKTAADGTFRVDLPLPGQLDLSSYEIYLSSLEDAYFNAALSD